LTVDLSGGFDAIVVGSGFGGAVAAARVAQAGLRVAILERGRRWPRGSFPRDSSDLKAGWLWQVGGGLFDLRWLDRMLSVQAAGWGGGSLIYANVFARPSDETFRPHWPVSYSRTSLDRYFDLAAYMLEVGPIQADPVSGEVPVRTRAMEDLVERMDRAAGTVRPNLAVRFAAEPNVPQPNRHGVVQHGCTFVGECVVGCNQGAKNSLDYNYLAVAERAGAVALTEAEVVRIEPGDGGYTVEYRDNAAGGARRVLRGQSLFLAAGAVGTTELLLRSRDVHKTLPDLSPRLGEGFSGNGDYLSLIRRTRYRWIPNGARPSPPPAWSTSTKPTARCGSRCRMGPTRLCSPGSSAALTRLAACGNASSAPGRRDRAERRSAATSGAPNAAGRSWPC
jgi:cholesterol oxidase